MKILFSISAILLASAVLLPDSSRAEESFEKGRTKYGHQYRSSIDNPDVIGPQLGHRLIQVQKGDYLSKIAAKYYWELIYKLNKDTIANPNRIEVGQWILVPTIGLTDPAKKKSMMDVIYASKNEVVFSDGTSQKSLAVGDELVDLGRIDSKAGYLTAGMGDGSQVRIKPNSSFNIAALRQLEDGTWFNKLQIDRGRAEFSKTISQQADLSEYFVSFPKGKVTGKSASFAVGIDRDKITRIEVYSNHLTVDSDRGDLLIPPGKGVLVGGNNFDFALVTLPIAVEGVDIEASDGGKTIDFSWRPVTGADHYILTLAEDLEMNKVLLRTTVNSGTAYTLKLTAPLGGIVVDNTYREYFCTVQAVNNSGLHGYPSAVNRWRIKK